MTFRSVENSLVSRVLHRSVPAARPVGRDRGELPSEAYLQSHGRGSGRGPGEAVRSARSAPGSTTKPRACPACSARAAARRRESRKRPTRTALIKVHKKWGEGRHLAPDQARGRQVHGDLLSGRHRYEARPRRQRRSTARRTADLHHAVHPNALAEHPDHRPCASCSAIRSAYLLATLAGQDQQPVDDPGAAALLDLAAGAHDLLDRAAAAGRRLERSRWSGSGWSRTTTAWP